MKLVEASDPVSRTTHPPSRSSFRWVICALLFFAATINYVDRQVLSVLAPMLRDAIEERLARSLDRIFRLLMGENVENRRRFIEENALDVRNLDV